VIGFQVQSPIYAGPLDLLLYLVRRQELDLSRVSIATIVEQYQQYVEVLSEIDIDGVGDFLDLASTLVEMKARLVFSSSESEIEGEAEEPISEPADQQLVQRLIEYQRLRDAAGLLEEQAQQWQLRHARLASDLPGQRPDPSQQPIADLEVWDLVSAFGRILRTHKPPPAEAVYHDDTPLQVHMQRIQAQVSDQGRVEFQELFRPGMHKSEMVALFLATLELVRHYSLSAVQSFDTGPLWLEQPTEAGEPSTEPDPNNPGDGNPGLDGAE